MRHVEDVEGESEEEPSSFRALAILVPLIVIAFSPVLVAGYLRLDDHAYLLDNPDVQHLSLSGLVAIWTRSDLGFYIPITYSLWWLYAGIANLLGTLKQSASLFHALNLCLHIINASLVFSLFQTLLRFARTKPAGLSEARTRGVAFITALFFALHPAQVETVAWITEVKGGLAGMLGLLGILSYYRSAKKATTAILFVAAMLSKPSAIIFPGVVLLIDRILLGKTLKDSMRAPIFFWMPLLPLVLITKVLQPDLNMEFIPSLSQRLLVAADAFSFYLAKLLFPLHLALDYGRSPNFVLHGVPGWQMALSLLLAVAGVAVVSYSLWRKGQAGRDGAPAWRSFVLCGWGIFCLALAPVLGLVPFAFQDFTTVADHYLYIPIFGASLAVLGLLIRLRATVGVLSVSAAILLALAGLTFSQSSHWRSTETLFSHTLEINPRSYLAHYSIGAELLDAGKTEAGIAQTLKCLEIKPSYLSAEVALGGAWIQAGKPENAIDYYLSVLGKNPSIAGKRAPFIASIHNNLGMALCQVGREREGAGHFKQAVEVDPTSVNGHMNLGRFALKEGRFSDAVTNYQAALALSPGNREIARFLELARSRAQRP